MSAPWWDSDWKDRSGREYRCFVGNLPYGISESSLKDAFSSYAPPLLRGELVWSGPHGDSARAHIDLVPAQFLMGLICRVLLSDAWSLYPQH